MKRLPEKEYVVTVLPMVKDRISPDTLRQGVRFWPPEVLSEDAFTRAIAVERQRTERSNMPFLLVLLDVANRPDSEKSRSILSKVAFALLRTVRETDVAGWWKDPATLGVIFTDLAIGDKSAVVNAILSRVSFTLRQQLTVAQLNQINISYYFFPDDWDDDGSGPACNQHLYPDLFHPGNGRRFQLCAKRGMDIVGSALLLILCAPLFAIISAAIKVSSKGPVFFKQQRVGQYGKSFTFLKFRSMQVGCDSSVHENFVINLIAGRVKEEPSIKNRNNIYKLRNDKRVTRVGRFLRRTSLDELPQLLNVFKGDMSLVGPRPPIPYELAAYRMWHRRRILHAKPGVSGLWQVTGRSRVKFDDMVRLDLRYSSSWTLWLDLKILFQTPLAVIRGVGAY
jgi:lipopolysaccharide/colanic/teichoic acid biosynthesis glycosyltransferase